MICTDTESDFGPDISDMQTAANSLNIKHRSYNDRISTSFIKSFSI